MRHNVPSGRELKDRDLSVQGDARIGTRDESQVKSQVGGQGIPIKSLVDVCSGSVSCMPKHAKHGNVS